jgi:hypothetical protein
MFQLLLLPTAQSEGGSTTTIALPILILPVHVKESVLKDVSEG